MKIIKHGKQTESKIIKTFICSGCGCIIKADNSEYKTEVDGNLVVHYCQCPECLKTAYEKVR